MQINLVTILLAQSASGSTQSVVSGLTFYVSIAVLGTFVAILGLFLRKSAAAQGSVETIPGWLAGGICGVLIGFGVGCGLMHSLGYRWSSQPVVIQQVSGPPMGGVMGGQSAASAPASPPGPGGMPGRGPGPRGKAAEKKADSPAEEKTEVPKEENKN